MPLSHLPGKIPLTVLFRGNPWRQLVRFPAGVPFDLQIILLTGNSVTAAPLTEQPVIQFAGTNTISVGLPSTNNLPDRLFMLYGWGGRTQLTGEVQVTRGNRLDVSGITPLLNITPVEGDTLVVESSATEIADLLAEVHALIEQVNIRLGGLNIPGASLLTTLNTQTVAEADQINTPGVQLVSVESDEDYDGTPGFYIRKGGDLHRIRTEKR